MTATAPMIRCGGSASRSGCSRRSCICRSARSWLQASQRPPPGDMLARDHRLALGLFLSLLAAGLVGMLIAVRASALPDSASGKMLAVFDPRLDEPAVFAALVRAGGRPLRRTWLPA